MVQLDQIDMANAGILLGLLPIFVATFGPTIAEIALLSSRRRPLLSFLLSVGVPAIFIIRPMAYADPLELLTPMWGEFTIPRFRDARVGRWLSGAEYAVVALAIFNISVGVVRVAAEDGVGVEVSPVHAGRVGSAACHYPFAGRVDV